MSGYVVQIDDILGPASLSVVDPPPSDSGFLLVSPLLCWF